MTWRDRRHPRAGGAELVNEEVAKRLARDGHEVKFIVGSFPGSTTEEKRDGFSIVRLGNRFTVYWKAYRYYKKHLRGTFDIVIDEMNTIPFFAKLYVKERNIMFVHQLCREIWFYEMPFPLSLIGYLLEPLYLRLLSFGSPVVVTVSESTKKDLLRFGFRSEKIHIISEGIEMQPLSTFDFPLSTKYSVPTILALGAIRAMKRTYDILKAFEHVRSTIPDARLILVGEPEGRYGKRVLAFAKRSMFARDIECVGKVDAAKKIELLQKSHVLAVASVKEGWGLTVTEANSQGTPAVVYDVDGLRDSVRDGETGIITKKNTPAALANSLARLLANESVYVAMQKNALAWSKEITFENSYRDFKNIVLKR